MTEPIDNNHAADNADDNVLSIEDRLIAHLKGEAELIPTDASLGQPASLATLRERAERRKNRRQAGLAAVAAACVAVVGFGVIQFNAPNDENDVAAIATSTTVPEEPVETSDSDPEGASGNDESGLVSSGPALNWQLVEGGLPNDIDAFSITATPDAFFAIDTPGFEAGTVHQTSVFRSEDGRTWLPIAEELDIDAYRITHSGGTLLLEGTEPGGDLTEALPSFETVYMLSTDNGSTWNQPEIPVPTQSGPTSGAPLDGVLYRESPSLSLAAIGDTIVIGVSTFRFVDVPALVGREGEVDYGYEIDDSGVRLYDENGNRGELIPFEDVPAFTESGMSASEFVTAIESELSSFAIYRSVDGGPFEETNLALPESPMFVALLAVGDSFIAQTFSQEGSSNHLRSTNGLDWEVTELDVELYGPANSGSSLIAYGPTGPAESLDGGETWTPITIGESNASVFEATRSDLGLTVIANGGVDNFPNVTPELTKDGITLRVEFSGIDSGGITLTDDETGEILREISFDDLNEDGSTGPGLIETDDGHFEIYDLDTGELLFQFTDEEFEDANPELNGPSGPDAFYIGHTQDGANFNWIPVSELGFGQDEFPNILATDDVVLLQAQGSSATEIYIADSLVN